jgi:hypothetical protein
MIILIAEELIDTRSNGIMKARNLVLAVFIHRNDTHQEIV